MDSLLEKMSWHPGVRFHPTDTELFMFYLKRKLTGRKLDNSYIADVDVYQFPPWDLPSKTLVFHEGKAPSGVRTDWVIHEYRMEDNQLAEAGVPQGAYVICKLYKKSGLGLKNGEDYGAPFVEEEWMSDNEDNMEGGSVGYNQNSLHSLNKATSSSSPSSGISALNSPSIPDAAFTQSSASLALQSQNGAVTSPFTEQQNVVVSGLIQHPEGSGIGYNQNVLHSWNVASSSSSRSSAISALNSRSVPDAAFTQSSASLALHSQNVAVTAPFTVQQNVVGSGLLQQTEGSIVGYNQNPNVLDAAFTQSRASPALLFQNVAGTALFTELQNVVGSGPVQHPKGSTGGYNQTPNVLDAAFTQSSASSALHFQNVAVTAPFTELQNVVGSGVLQHLEASTAGYIQNPNVLDATFTASSAASPALHSQNVVGTAPSTEQQTFGNPVEMFNGDEFYFPMNFQGDSDFWALLNSDSYLELNDLL